MYSIYISLYRSKSDIIHIYNYDTSNVFALIYLHIHVYLRYLTYADEA